MNHKQGKKEYQAMNNNLIGRKILFFAALMCIGSLLAAEPPKLLVNFCAKPPVVDGIINDDEYREASAITGL